VQKETVTLTLRPQYNKTLAELATKEGVAKGSMVEKALDAYIAQQEKNS